jgi:hypothetical protein
MSQSQIRFKADKRSELINDQIRFGVVDDVVNVALVVLLCFLTSFSCTKWK